MIFAGIRIAGKHSYTDYHGVMTARKIGTPSPKRITVELPFVNGSYDFSELYGAQPYGDRELEYTFDVTTYSKSEVETYRRGLINWLMAAGWVTLQDDYIPEYHFYARCTECTSDVSGLVCTVTAKFAAHPFMYKNNQTAVSWSITSSPSEQTITVQSIPPVLATVTCADAIIITYRGADYSFPAGTTADGLILYPGEQVLTITGQGNVSITWTDEVI